MSKTNQRVIHIDRPVMGIEWPTFAVKDTGTAPRKPSVLIKYIVLSERGFLVVDGYDYRHTQNAAEATVFDDHDDAWSEAIVTGGWTVPIADEESEENE